MSDEIYLDNHATTMVDPVIADRLPAFLASCYGNASSIDHARGEAAAAVVDEVREQLGRLYNAPAKGVVFTSGATESANLVIQDVLRRHRLPAICLSAVEHPCVAAVEQLARQGLCEARVIPVDGRGVLDLDVLAAKAPGCALGCFMAANNEIGTVYPIAQIGKLLHDHGVPSLVDATQSVGYLPLDMAKSRVDYLIFSGHKVHALPGVGVLIARNPKALPAGLFIGGEQQGGVRPGTIPVPGVWTLGQALRFSPKERDQHAQEIAARRDRLWGLLQEKSAGELVRTGNPKACLPNNLHFCIRGVDHSFVVNRLRGNVALSTGSACSSGAVARSPVLAALGLPDDLANGSLRIGLSRFTTDDEIEVAAGRISEAINDVRQLLIA